MKSYTLEQELELEIRKQNKIRNKQFEHFQYGTATRAKTTTLNARADWHNERIESLRSEIKKQKS